MREGEKGRKGEEGLWRMHKKGRSREKGGKEDSIEKVRREEKVEKGI